MGLALGEVQIELGHESGQFLEGDLGRPAEFLARLGRITEEVIDFGGTVEAGINLDIFFLWSTILIENSIFKNLNGGIR